MTEENKRFNIGQEVAKAERDLRHAQLLFANEGFDGAVTHAYYHAYHCARALLLMEGLESKTHSGLTHVINQYFVLTGRLSPENAQVLRQLEKERESADYDAAAIFTAAMAEAAIESARRFGEAARGILKLSGYL